MSNNTRRPTSGGSYSDGKGRRPVQQPPQPQKQSSQLHIPDGFMYVLALMFFFAGGFMFLCFKIGRAFFMFVLGVTLLPVLSDILLKIVPNPRSMGVRIITNRFLRIAAALLIGFIIGISFLVSLVNDGREARENGLLDPTPSPTIEATATPTPTAEPTATPTPTIAPENAMTVEEVIELLDSTIANTQEEMGNVSVTTSFEDDFYNIFFTPDHSVLYAFMLLSEPDDLSVDELATMTRDYEALTAEFCSISARCKEIFDENGHTNCHVMVHILNPENTDNVLYSSIDGYHAYSVLTEK